MRRLRLELLEDRRLLASVIVGNNLDIVNGTTTSIAALIAPGGDGGDGISLREAILAANATAGADHITFDGVLNGQTITLSGTELVVSEAVTIEAGALKQNMTIDANQESRIFNITATTGSFTLAGLTLTGGRTTGYGESGGAIRSATQNNLTLNQCTVIGNGTEGDNADGGGIFASDFLTLTQSTVVGNHAAGDESQGGGIYALERFTATDSTVSENYTDGTNGDGGGIYVGHGDATVTRSTIQGNQTRKANAAGGGIFVGGSSSLPASVTLSVSTVDANSTLGTEGDGGGIYVYWGDVALTNSTVSNNRVSGTDADGGGICVYYVPSGIPVVITQSTLSSNSATGSGADGGGVVTVYCHLWLNQSTVTQNHTSGYGGGLHQYDSSNNYICEIDNSIVAVNTAVEGSYRQDISQDTNPIFNFSLIGVANLLDTGSTSMSGRLAYPLDPCLGGLADNGGPTWTHMPLAGSPAINHGNYTDLTNDQRGVPFLRLSGGWVDIGAIERQTIEHPSLIVDTVVDERDGDYSEGDLSLREAIMWANASAGVDTITFAPELSGQTIALGGTELRISDTLEIEGRNLAEKVTIDGGGLSRIFNIVATEGNFGIKGFKLTGGRTNTAGDDGRGGAIRSATTGGLWLDQMTISNNSTHGDYADGGGIYVNSSLYMSDSTVSNNSTTGYDANGGGIFCGLVQFSNSTVSGNETFGVSADGGGIFVLHASQDWTIIQCTISGNKTHGDDADGGGIAVQFGMNPIISNCTITQNTATLGWGGGIWFCRGAADVWGATINNSIVAGNTSPNYKDVNHPFLDASEWYKFNVYHSLIGTDVDPDVGHGNIHSDFAGLMELADNGGPTQTHALLPGSPAIDAGDPDIVYGPDSFDQRGDPFVRVLDGNGSGGARIDTGAFELQPMPAAFFGDYNQNGIVDAADYVLWQKTLRTTGVSPYSGADGNGNGRVDSDDYGVWRANFGRTLPLTAAGSGALGLVFSQSASEFADEAVVPARSERTSASVEANLNVSREARLVMLDPRAALYDFVSQPRKLINVSAVAELGSDNLLLLAIDRGRRTSAQYAAVIDDVGSDDQDANDMYSESLVEDPLAMALAEWQRESAVI